MAEVVNPPEEGNPARVTEQQSDIPEKLRGKSVEELAKMYQSLEGKLGEQSQELGELRSAMEQVYAGNGSSQSEDSGEVDFYNDPERAIRRLIKEQLSPYEKVVQEQREQAVISKLDKEHPGWKDTVQDNAFQTWVAGSKKRMQMFVEANAADYDSANELLTLWKERRASSNEVKERENRAVDRDRKLRAATTERGSSGIDPRKILSRSDLRELRRTNPNRYNELLPQIRQAYAEGRVKE